MEVFVIISTTDSVKIRLNGEDYLVKWIKNVKIDCI